MNEMLNSYLEDLKDNILVFNEALMELEKNHGDFENINSIFRVAHTIKGNSGAMEFKNIEKPMHIMEDLLQSSRDGGEEITDETITILYACHDFLEDCLDRLSEDGSDEGIDPSAILQKLEQLKNGGKNTINIEGEALGNIREGSLMETMDNNLLEVVKANIARGHFVYIIKVELNPESSMKWMRAWLAFQKMEDYVVYLHSKPEKPEEEELRSNDMEFEGNVLEVLVYSEDDNIEVLAAELETLIEIQNVTYTAFGQNEKSESKAEESKKAIDRKTNSNGKSMDKKESKRDELMRIPVKKVDNLMDMLGELLILNSQLELQFEDSEMNSAEISNTLPRMVKIVKQIQTLSMSLRMIECKATLHRLTRIARDTAAALGKEIKVVLEGEETEIDRSISEKIFDPLMHMVRNAVSHGIEDKETRIKAGKPPHGTVTISAYNKRGNVFIDVKDDGEGINLEKVKSKAIKQGIASADTQYTEDEILKFIFTPGFSTQQEVNNISGRGVGMNVVEAEVKKMRGRVDIKSEYGVGSTFQIKIPMNLALLSGTVVSVDEEQYIIPTLYINEFYIAEENDIILMQGNENAIKIRDNIVPILTPGKLFGQSGKEATNRNKNFVILEMEQKLVAFPVDKIIGKQEIVSKNLGEEFDDIKYAAGASILGDGHVAIILDVEAVFNAAKVKL